MASRPRREVANSRRIVLSSRCSSRREALPLRYWASAASTLPRVVSRRETQCESGRSGAGRGRVERRTHQYQTAIAAGRASPTIHTQVEYAAGGTGSWIGAESSSASNTLLPPQQYDELIDQVVGARGAHRLDPAPAQHLAHLVAAGLGEGLRLALQSGAGP